MKESTIKAYQGQVARMIAYEILKLPRVCEVCRTAGRVEVHHINKDRTNNSRENIMILCRKCHNLQHDTIIYTDKSPELAILEELPRIDRRVSPSSKTLLLREKRRKATEEYRNKWGLP
jgi:5-methylcytosine-specific restriction endonuclease McrA